MDTRKVAMELRLSQWSVVLRERKSSGLSVREWCRSNGVGEKTYYYWQRKIRESVCRELPVDEVSGQSLVPSGWAQCQSAPDTTSNSNAVIIEIGGCRITATASTDPDLLAKVCRVLLQC